MGVTAAQCKKGCSLCATFVWRGASVYSVSWVLKERDHLHELGEKRFNFCQPGLDKKRLGVKRSHPVLNRDE